MPESPTPPGGRWGLAQGARPQEPAFEPVWTIPSSPVSGTVARSHPGAWRKGQPLLGSAASQKHHPVVVAECQLGITSWDPGKLGGASMTSLSQIWGLKTTAQYTWEQMFRLPR